MAEPLGGRGTLAHRPVLLRETIELLAAERGGMFVDCTVGLGGHSEAILETSRDAQVLGIDRDDEALELARKRLARFGPRFRAVHADFRRLLGTRSHDPFGVHRCSLFNGLTVFSGNGDRTCVGGSHGCRR